MKKTVRTANQLRDHVAHGAANIAKLYMMLSQEQRDAIDNCIQKEVSGWDDNVITRSIHDKTQPFDPRPLVVILAGLGLSTLKGLLAYTNEQVAAMKKGVKDAK